METPTCESCGRETDRLFDNDYRCALCQMRYLAGEVERRAAVSRTVAEGVVNAVTYEGIHPLDIRRAIEARLELLPDDTPIKLSAVVAAELDEIEALLQREVA